MNLGTIIYTWLRGNYVGKDHDGNKYYSSNKNIYSRDAKRWVIFKGEIEASRIPPHWHAWLHKMTDDPPINYKHTYNWQKKHQSNKTGTSEAYYPSSHPLSKSSKNYKPKPDYESWKP
tara:strand:+ start:831 stop:1184 length:354 start_codon:yes stop_codon:yes gene_type:complete